MTHHPWNLSCCTAGGAAQHLAVRRGLARAGRDVRVVQAPVGVGAAALCLPRSAGAVQRTEPGPHAGAVDQGLGFKV